MRGIGIALFALSTMAAGAVAAPSTDVVVSQPVTKIEHGGGCRKSSPAGQCCHKQTSTGQVHCH